VQEPVLALPVLHGLPRGRTDGEHIRIGEAENTVRLQKEEWNILVDLSESGRLGPIRGVPPDSGARGGARHAP
jgi:hypothetical protein